MNSLAREPLPTILSKLFSEASVTQALFHKEAEKFTPQERAEWMTSTTNYRALYTAAKDFHLAVSRETATLLYMLARAIAARSIIEFGTSFGVSTLHLAAAVRDNGGGRIISTEFEPSKVAQARATIAAAGFADLVELREEDALETLRHDLPTSIDMVFLDGAKALYPQVLALVEERLRPAALVVADNADWSQDYLDHVRAPASGYLSVPLASEVELSIRTAG